MTTKITFDTFETFHEDTDEPITSFAGKWEFLSNFSQAKVKLDGADYSTVEAAYQDAKTVNKKERTPIRNADTPAKAKQLGKLVTIRPDWKDIKLSVMEELLRQKFAPFKDDYFKLLQTHDRELIEGNTWHDTFWGVCNGKGNNHLGLLLMRIRNEYFHWSCLK